MLPAGLPPGGTRGSQGGSDITVAELLQGMGKGIVISAVSSHTFLSLRSFCLLLFCS